MSFDQTSGNGIQSFNRELFGTDLFDEQIEWLLKAQKPVNTLAPGNSWGKTELLARDAVRRAWYKLSLSSIPYWWARDPELWTTMDWRGLTAAYEYDTAAESFKRLMLRVDRGEVLAQLVRKMTRGEQPQMQFANGSILDWGSLGEKGKHVEATRRQLVQIDEVGHVNDFEMIYNDVLFPRTLGVDGIILLYGTPKEHTDPFVFEIYEDGLVEGHPFYTSMSGSSLNNPYWPAIDRARTLANPAYVNPDGSFTPKGRQVIEGAFLGVGHLWFHRAAIRRMFSGEHTWYVPERNASGIYAAWDLGGSRPKSDATVGITVDTGSFPYRVCRVDHLQGRDYSWSMKYDLIEEAYHEQGVELLGIDVTGALSDAVEEELAERGLNIYPFRLGGTSALKHNLLRNLQAMMDQQEDDRLGAFRWPNPKNHPELIARRKEFEKYKYPDDKHLETDTVMAMGMLAQIVSETAVPPPVFGQVY